MRSIVVRLGVSVLLTPLFLLSPPVSAQIAGSAGVSGWFEVPKLRDGISPEQRRDIRRAIEAYEKQGKRLSESTAGGEKASVLYPFYPQAGVPGQDLFMTNFTDLDPERELIRDWDCSSYTYDGHQGHDSAIRSFREQAIGVPVFAVLDGVVVDTHDGEPDTQTEWNPRNRANYVVIDHGGGYTGLYAHFKTGSVAVARGQAVTAGTQIGLTGSSGISTGPHLHFESWKDEEWFEPSAGPCRTGDSFWVAQPPVMRDFYVADFFMTRGTLEIFSWEGFLFDTAERTATFVRGSQRVSLRIDLRNVPPAVPYRLRILDPRGKPVYELSELSGNPTAVVFGFGLFHLDLNLNAAGTWRTQLEIDGGTVLNAPFRVVETARQIQNRPPNRITVRLDPPRPQSGKVMTCSVRTSLIAEDPDYDVVSYRYEWRVNGRLVRSVTSAALTDLLPAGKAQPRDRVACRVVPSDGRGRGRAAVASLLVEEL